MRRTIMNLARAKVLKFEDLDSSKCNWVKTQKIFYEDPEGKREWTAEPAIDGGSN